MRVKSFLIRIGQAFLTGLAAVLPIGITLYLVYLLFEGIERFFKNFIPEAVYWPGTGIAFGVIVVILVGLSLRAWAVRKVYNYLDSVVQKIPVFNTVYGTARDLIDFFSGDKENQMGQTVMVTLSHDPPVRLMGFLTREDFSVCPEGIGRDEDVAVYLPMSYQIGGFTVMMPRSRVERIDMTFQDAMRFTLTAGMAVGAKSVPTIAGAVEAKVDGRQIPADTEERPPGEPAAAEPPATPPEQRGVQDTGEERARPEENRQDPTENIREEEAHRRRGGP